MNGKQKCQVKGKVVHIHLHCKCYSIRAFQLTGDILEKSFECLETQNLIVKTQFSKIET